MATQGEPVADGVPPHGIENVIPGSTLVEDACESTVEWLRSKPDRHR
jgi:hypothetical protein